MPFKIHPPSKRRKGPATKKAAVKAPLGNNNTNAPSSLAAAANGGKDI